MTNPTETTTAPLATHTVVVTNGFSARRVLCHLENGRIHTDRFAFSAATGECTQTDYALRVDLSTLEARVQPDMVAAAAVDELEGLVDCVTCTALPDGWVLVDDAASRWFAEATDLQVALPMLNAGWGEFIQAVQPGRDCDVPPSVLNAAREALGLDDRVSTI